jgi:predicted Zn-dependent peptidase
LNATTSSDATRYFYSLPSNKLELWMSLESERFLDPVFREFFEEKNVILEERRMRVDNSPHWHDGGRVFRSFL